LGEKLKITQIRSTIGRIEKQKQTIKALGIRKLYRSVIHKDTPQIRGMIEKVKHLVKIEEIWRECPAQMGRYVYSYISRYRMITSLRPPLPASDGIFNQKWRGVRPEGGITGWGRRRKKFKGLVTKWSRRSSCPDGQASAWEIWSLLPGRSRGEKGSAEVPGLGMGRLLPGDIKDRKPDPALKEEPGLKGDRCPFKDAFPKEDSPTSSKRNIK
jgi:large subunit ribosomal protein L30